MPNTKIALSKEEKLSQDDQILNSKITETQQKIITSYKAKFDKNKKWYDRLADVITVNFGTLWFLVLHFLLFSCWIIINTGFVKAIVPFDPYPFGFLTMVVSLEAIFLAIIVQISINRQAKIGDLREEIDFNVNVRAEREITKILNLVDKIHDHLGMENEDDDELLMMKEDIDLDEVEKEIESQYE